MKSAGKPIEAARSAWYSVHEPPLLSGWYELAEDSSTVTPRYYDARVQRWGRLASVPGKEKQLLFVEPVGDRDQWRGLS